MSVELCFLHRNTTPIKLDLPTYDKQEFLLFRIHMAACSTVVRTSKVLYPQILYEIPLNVREKHTLAHGLEEQNTE